MVNNTAKFTATKSVFFKLIKLAAILLAVFSLNGCHQSLTGVLNPKGLITYEERQVLFDVLALMLIVVIPVIVMSFAFVIRYRASHSQAEYKPNWSDNSLLETIWWGIPCVLILVLGIMIWKLTHKLDPYRKINVPGKPMLIEAVALPWKWLFIYPEQNIATVNFVEIPKGQQVEFWLTNDNVAMSAFFIPQLSSQIYTMAGMRTRLHLLALEVGTFEGLNAQYNGDGFSDMHFAVKVVDPKEMSRWVKQVKKSSSGLTQERYKQLTQPAIKYPVEYFSSADKNLFKQIINKYKQTDGIPTKWNYSPTSHP